MVCKRIEYIREFLKGIQPDELILTTTTQPDSARVLPERIYIFTTEIHENMSWLLAQLAEKQERDVLFEEMEAEIRFNFHGPKCCDACDRKHAIITKIDALKQKGSPYEHARTERRGGGGGF